MKPMAKAYYSHREPLYNDMMIIFALDNAKNEEVLKMVIKLDKIQMISLLKLHLYHWTLDAVDFSTAHQTHLHPPQWMFAKEIHA